LAELEDAAQAVRGQDGQPHGQLAATAPVLFGRMYVMPIVAGLLSEHPELSIRVVLVDRVMRLAGRRRRCSPHRSSSRQRPTRRADGDGAACGWPVRTTSPGAEHLSVSGNGGKKRYLPPRAGTNGLINDYLDAAGHGEDLNGAVFRPIRNRATGELDKAISPDASISWCARTRPNLGLRSVRMRYGRQPPPTRSIICPCPRERAKIPGRSDG
jgi:hypothetical protein